MKRSHFLALVIALLVLVSVLRTVQSYRITAPGFDENCHISVGAGIV